MRRHSRGRKILVHAVYLLAVGEGDVRQRLKRIHRDLRSLDERDLPLELYAELRSILNEMTRFGPARDERDGEPYQSAIEHTMCRSRRSTASKLAKRIYSLHSKLC